MGSQRQGIVRRVSTRPALKPGHLLHIMFHKRQGLFEQISIDAYRVFMPALPVPTYNSNTVGFGMVGKTRLIHGPMNHQEMLKLLSERCVGRGTKL